MNSLIGDSVASPTVWAVTVVVTVGFLLVDLLVIGRRPHEPSMKEVARHLAFFVGAAVKLAREGAEEEDEYQENKLVLFVERRFPATKVYHSTRLFIREDGKRLITPMFVVVLTLGTTDLLFALDSIPAIYGLTSDPYLVFTANIFALMGLRQLYFLIGGLLQRLIFLSYGLAVLLGFIGVKLVMHALHENMLPFINGGEPIHASWLEIPIWLSLAVIVGTLAVTTVVSLAVSRSRAQREARDERGVERGPSLDLDNG